MGFAPLKLNSSANDLCSFDQCGLHILRQTKIKIADKRFHLFISYLEMLMDAIDHGLKDDPKSIGEGNVRQLVRQEKEDLAKCSQILVLPACHCKKHISCKNDRHVRSKRVVGKAMAFTYKIQHGFAGFEEDFYLPAFAIYPNDLFF